MKKQPFVNFNFAGVNLTEFGLEVPSPFCSLELSNSQIDSMTAWTLNVIIGSSDTKKANSAAFEALLYSAAQSASGYANSRGIPVYFVFGWLDDKGNVSEYISYQGYTVTFSVSANGLYLVYKVTGFAELCEQFAMPVLRIPSLCGFVQPSAVLEGIAIASKATNYYLLDIDHNDVPTLVNHGPLTTSFNSYARGTIKVEDNYQAFPGLLKLSKSYSKNQDSSGLIEKYRTLGQVMNNRINTPLQNFFKSTSADETPKCITFSYWVDEPTMTSPGTIHYKSNANLLNLENKNTLRYGTSNDNILSVSGTYNGVAYNMTNMNFSQVGFIVDGSGEAIAEGASVVNSWSATLADVYQTANIINDVNALATQFTNDFTITIPGAPKGYQIAQPVALVVFTGNTLSPISGIYNIMSVSHKILNTFITTLKLQRLVMSSANQVMASMNILSSGSASYSASSYTTTKNVVSPYKVDFGEIYPNFEYLDYNSMKAGML